MKLGRAVQLAAASGHEDTMRLLQKVVDVDDAEQRDRAARKGTEKAAEMTLDTRSTRTVRLGKQAEARRRGGQLMATVTCPAGHESSTDDYCDTCGAPIGAAPPAEEGGATGPRPIRGRAGGRGRGRARGGRGPACPGCGEPVVGRFCESCGYDVEKGAPGGPASGEPGAGRRPHPLGAHGRRR